MRKGNEHSGGDGCLIWLVAAVALFLADHASRRVQQLEERLVAAGIHEAAEP